MDSDIVSDWFYKIPKIELHLHLEGAIPIGTLWKLVQKYGGDPSIPDRGALEAKFRYIDFPHFIKAWIWKNQFIREYEDFTLIAEAVANQLAQMNTRYSEVFYSPPDFFQHGLNTQDITVAIRKGLDLVPEVEVALVTDLVRDYGPENAATTLSQVNEVSDLGVVGIGIGGSEQGFPPELFEDVFESARELGLRTTAHAGEAAGSSSIWGVINSLRVDRIGHGTRAFEDPKLLKHLIEHQIPLEICPISNVCTGVVPSLKDHPLRSYYDQGLSITINTDDPVMFDTSLAKEYRSLVTDLGFSHSDIKDLILNGLRSSWLPPNRKKTLQDEFIANPAWELH